MKRLLGALLLPLLFAPAAKADEQSFIEQIEQLGIPYTTEELLLEAGWANCEALETYTYYEVVYWVGMATDNSTTDIDNVVASGIRELCPQHYKMIPQGATVMNRR